MSLFCSSANYLHELKDGEVGFGAAAAAAAGEAAPPNTEPPVGAAGEPPKTDVPKDWEQFML